MREDVREERALIYPNAELARELPVGRNTHSLNFFLLCTMFSNAEASLADRM